MPINITAAARSIKFDCAKLTVNLDCTNVTILFLFRINAEASQVEFDKMNIRCNESHHLQLYEQLETHAAKWRKIGTHLGFSQGDLDNIASNPQNLLAGAPESYLSAMLSKWLQWAPGDGRGSKQYATLSALKSAASLARLGTTGQELKLTSQDKATN